MLGKTIGNIWSSLPPPLKESLPKTTKEQPESNEYN